MKTKFVTIPEKGITKAFLNDFRDVTFEILYDESISPLGFMIINYMDDMKNFKLTTVDKNDNDIPFCAEVTCKEGDEFDAVEGMDIAEEKASARYHEAMIKDYKKIIKKLEFFIEKLNKKIDKHQKKVDTILDSLKKR